MKKFVISVAMLLILVSLSACAPKEDTEKNNVSDGENISVEAAHEKYSNESIQKILAEEIRLYELACNGLSFNRSSNEISNWQFASLYCQESEIELVSESDMENLIKDVTEIFFGVDTNEINYSNGIGFETDSLTFTITECHMNEDSATVTVSREWEGEELFDNTYTFKKIPLPEKIKGSNFEQLSFEDNLWIFETVVCNVEKNQLEVVDISTPEQFMGFAMGVDKGENMAVNGHFRLMNDIDLSQHDLEPIGIYDDRQIWDSRAINLKSPMGFNGVFEGNNHTISGVNIVSDLDTVGFFQVINDDAIVKDLTINGKVSSSYIDSGNTQVGGFVGILSNNAEILNCHFVGEVNGFSSVGGFAGTIGRTTNHYDVDEEGFERSGTGLISDCTVDVSVSAPLSSGGFVGALNGNLNNCRASGIFTIPTNSSVVPQGVGGFCGSLLTDLNNCNSGIKVEYAIDGANIMGNFVGSMMNNDITNCTIHENVVNPDWYMVGRKDYKESIIDVVKVS